MKRVILAAVDLNYAIGNQGRLPWKKQQADMKHFIELTMGFPLIIGRKTYESVQKRPLPGRTNIVITRQGSYAESGIGCVIVRSCEDAFRIAEQEQKEMVFIIGGAEIYRQTLSIADELDLTMIHYRFRADTFFPEIDPRIWRKIGGQHYTANEQNEHPYSFFKFKRIHLENKSG